MCQYISVYSVAKLRSALYLPADIHLLIINKHSSFVERGDLCTISRRGYLLTPRRISPQLPANACVPAREGILDPATPVLIFALTIHFDTKYSSLFHHCICSSCSSSSSSSPNPALRPAMLVASSWCRCPVDVPCRSAATHFVFTFGDTSSDLAISFHCPFLLRQPVTLTNRRSNHIVWCR